MKWGVAERAGWLREQKVQRSYRDEVVSKILALESTFAVIPYGALSVDPLRYPLYLLRSKTFDPNRKTALVTGGVHGYETSGPHGALDFLTNHAAGYAHQFNLVVVPCLSPWAYETINRWNPHAVDPNRSFVSDSPAEECRLFLAAMAAHHIRPYVHFDLHETTDTDNSVFRPALEARDGVKQAHWETPDGFYVVGDAENPQPEFQGAVIAAVARVTHIAPTDREGRIIGESSEQAGVIHYPLKQLGLCAGFSDAEFTTTTEVYPDSPRANAAICAAAQSAAIRGGLDYLLARVPPNRRPG